MILKKLQHFQNNSHELKQVLLPNYIHANSLLKTALHDSVQVFQN